MVYAVLSAPGGCPVAVQAYPGNTADPNTVPDQVAKLQERFGLERVVLVGDRGLLTQVQIEHLKRHRGLGRISALKAPQIRALVEQDALQLSLFDEQNLAEFVSPEYPGERLVACYNPLLAEERSRKREELLGETEVGLERDAREAAPGTAVAPGRLALGTVHLERAGSGGQALSAESGRRATRLIAAGFRWAISGSARDPATRWVRGNPVPPPADRP